MKAMETKFANALKNTKPPKPTTRVDDQTSVNAIQTMAKELE
jgi:hypothetical protein